MKVNSFPHRPSGGRARARGFTLIELLITVTVLGILLAIALPSFARMMASNRMSTQSNEFIAAINLARSEAVRRVQPVSILADNTGIEFSTGWSVFTDSNADGAKGSTDADGTVLRVGGALSGRTSIKRVTSSYADSTASDKQYVVFNSFGSLKPGTATAFFKVCDTGLTSLPGRIIQVSVVGKASVISTTATCS